MVHLTGIERPFQGAGHDIVALRAVLAPDVLEDPNVAVGREHLVALRQDRQHVRRLVPLDPLGGVVGRAGQDDRRILRPLWNDDGRMQFHPVPHGDHHVTLDVVVGRRRCLELSGNVGSERRDLGRDTGPERQKSRRRQQAEAGRRTKDHDDASLYWTAIGKGAAPSGNDIM